MVFLDRADAGKQLARALSFLKGQEGVVILAIPRGGVPVAVEVARSLGAPLDVVVVRKVGAPGDPELAVGAVTQDGEFIADKDVLGLVEVSPVYIKAEAGRQAEEVKRRMAAYRGAAPYPDLSGKTVVVVDDGIATGSTMEAAARSAVSRGAGKVVLAAPVAAPEAVARLSNAADRVVCVDTPEGFGAIGQFYDDFEQVDDETVRALLGAMRRRTG